MCFPLTINGMSSPPKPPDVKVILEFVGTTAPELVKATCDFPHIGDKSVDGLNESKIADLPQALAVILVKFKAAKRSDQFRVHAKSAQKMEMLRFIKRAKNTSLSQMSPIRGLASGEFLKLFNYKGCGDTGQTIQVNLEKLYHWNVTIKVDGDIIEDSKNLGNLAVRIAATRNWELGDYEFSSPNTARKAVPARIESDIGEHQVPPAIQGLLEQADKLDAEGNYPEALVVSERAMIAAEQTQHERAILKAKIGLAQALIRSGTDLSRASMLLNSCLTQIPPGKNDAQRVTVLHLLGHIAMSQGRINESKSYALDALDIARSLNNRFKIGAAQLAVGQAEEMLGNLHEALRILGEAAENFRWEFRNGDERTRTRAAINLAGCLMTRAGVFQHLGNAPETLTCLSEAEEILRQGDSPMNLGQTLLKKSRVLFALSQIERGAAALQDAWKIFQSGDDFSGMMECIDGQVRLALHLGHPQEALDFASLAVNLARQPERKKPRDLIEALTRMATLCGMFGIKVEEDKYKFEAKEIAIEHQLHDLIADCLSNEAGEGKAKSKDQKSLLRNALEHLFLALEATQVRGRRAVFMKRIATAYARLGNLPETRSWLEQALSVFEEIGDAGGILQVLANLAGLAHEEGNSEAAGSQLESLIDRAKGKPFEHFRANAHHDLVLNRISQGDIPSAQRHLNAAKALCQNNRFSELEKALQDTEERLETLIRIQQPAPADLANMLRDLRRWTDRFPEQAEAILPAWFYLFGAEARSNCRSLVGVKFLGSSAKSVGELWFG